MQRGMSAEYPGVPNELSETAKTAFQDLKALGYDIEALGRRRMKEEQIVALRDKAFKFRGMQIPSSQEPRGIAELANLFELGVDLSLRSPPAEARQMARHILYLAEKQLAEP
jgi:hypothetical protein